ncbi:hypothetical protein GGI07_005698 [Coemansia sp. Benny D115]|nr:hypothetical protein GGI07_005698 [Coemansia sp. Benny D115]
MHSRSSDNLPISQLQINDERQQEAKLYAKKIEEVFPVLENTIPRDVMSRANAETVATAVAASLEDYIEGRSLPSTSSAQNDAIGDSGGVTDQPSASLDRIRVLYKKGKLDAANYMNMLAIIKAKKYISNQSTAYEQLFLYTRNLYVCQFDCRFMWGFTVCGSIFCVCIITNDKVYLSDKIDLRKSEGRSELVTLLCNMSFCEVDQLGYDPSISYKKDENRWEITIFDDAEIADGKPG